MSCFRCSPKTYENCYYSKLSEIYNKHMDPDIPQEEINICNLLLGPDELKLIEGKNLYSKKHQDESIKKMMNKADNIKQLKHKLKEDVLKEKLKECTFQPRLKNTTQNDDKRKLNEFLLDQKTFLERKHNNAKKLEEEVRLKIDENLTLTPSICKQSMEIIGKKSKSPIDFRSLTHQRLYSYHSKTHKSKEKNNDLTLFKQQPQKEEKLFSPNINDRSKKLFRNEGIHDRLYKQRKITEDKINKLRDISHQKVKAKRESTSDDELLTKKFTKEFYMIVNNLDLDSQNITYIQMNEIMGKLGFLTQNQNPQFPSFHQERTLLSQLWSTINENNNSTILIFQFLLSLLAILGLPAPPQPSIFSPNLPSPLEKDIGTFFLSPKVNTSSCSPPPLLAPSPPSLNFLSSTLQSPSLIVKSQKATTLLPPPNLSSPMTQKKIGRLLIDSKETIKREVSQERNDIGMHKKYRMFYENRLYNEKLGKHINARTGAERRRNFSVCDDKTGNQIGGEMDLEGKKILRDSKNETPFLIADVNIGNNRIEQIKIFENDNTETLVRDFATKHNFDLHSQTKLKHLLDSKIDALIKKLELSNPT